MNSKVKQKLKKIKKLLDLNIIPTDTEFEGSSRRVINCCLIFTLLLCLSLALIITVSMVNHSCIDNRTGDVGNNSVCFLNNQTERDLLCPLKEDGEENPEAEYQYDFSNLNFLLLKAGNCFCCGKGPQKFFAPESNPWPLAFGIVMSFIIIFFTSLFCGLRKKRPKTLETSTRSDTVNIVTIDDDDNDTSLKNSKHKDYALILTEVAKISNVPRASFSFDQLGGKLGEGQFGVVFKGSFLTEPNSEVISVAIKQLHQTINDSNTTTVTSFLNEIKVMNAIGSHPNIVGLLGACVDPIKKGDAFGILELCEKGDLKSYLRNSAELPAIKTTLKCHPILNGYMLAQQMNEDYVKEWDDEEFKKQTLPQFLCWAIDIANGMMYLGEKNIIHIDLAARNILLTKSLNAKIADFGLSRKLYYYKDVYDKTGNDPIPLKWLALEALTDNKYSKKSDIWSYGVTLWEIFSFGKEPFVHLGPKEFIGAVLGGIRLPRPEHCSKEIYSKMLSCWNDEPVTRPSAADMLNYFDSLIKAIPEL